MPLRLLAFFQYFWPHLQELLVLKIFQDWILLLAFPHQLLPDLKVRRVLNLSLSRPKY